MVTDPCDYEKQAFKWETTKYKQFKDHLNRCISHSTDPYPEEHERQVLMFTDCVDESSPENLRWQRWNSFNWLLQLLMGALFGARSRISICIYNNYYQTLLVFKCYCILYASTVLRNGLAQLSSCIQLDLWSQLSFTLRISVCLNIRALGCMFTLKYTLKSNNICVRFVNDIFSVNCFLHY